MENETYKLYNGEVTLQFNDAKHTYLVNDKIVPSATAVTGIINKPALMYWAVNKTIECLQKVLIPGKALDELQIKALLESAKNASRVHSDEAKDIGTLVHESIERYIKTGKAEYPVNEKAKNAFTKFMEWQKEHKVEFVESERKIYSRKWEYAGTMDFVAKIEGKTYVGDFKTSSAVYDEYFFQTAGYQIAYQEETGMEIDGNVIVRIGKDATMDVVYSDEFEKNSNAFLGALALYNRVKELKDEQFKKEQLI